jgi:hypothetical protein
MSKKGIDLRYQSHNKPVVSPNNMDRLIESLRQRKPITPVIKQA